MQDTLDRLRVCKRRSRSFGEVVSQVQSILQNMVFRIIKIEIGKLGYIVKHTAFIFSSRSSSDV